MIRIDSIDVHGWDAAIRGMRNPLNSWAKSDSSCGEVGPNDLDLMRRLIMAGAPDRKFMRFITVSMDITCAEYWWPEFDTYKVGTVRNSCSKMHKIHSRDLTRDDFSTEHMTDDSLILLDHFLDNFNRTRRRYIETRDKADWWQLIQTLPMSYNQTATVLLNYEVLRNIYHTRRNHKQDEWRDFCRMIETLPYSELITMEVK